MAGGVIGVRDETAFLEAWQRGVTIAGPQFFGDGSGAGRTKWDLAPRVEDIEEFIGVLSSGEATFLAAMVSFYNGRVGGELLTMLSGGYAVGLADIAGGLDPVRRGVIADLLLSYAGW